jgi:starch synthase
MNQPAARPVPFAFVHHANQYLITDGYDNRDGISAIADGYMRVLALHRHYQIPASLHLSGTLLEALAWHRPALLDSVADLIAEGLICLVGGTYAEPIMTLFPPDIVSRQLQAPFALYDNLLGCPADRVKTCWVPERVWDPRLVPLLEDEDLPNGGYRYIFLDDRLLFPTNGSYPGSPRACFDSCPFGVSTSPPAASRFPEACRVYRIAGGSGLGVIPMSADLRYCIPPRTPEHLRRVRTIVHSLAHQPEGVLLVYADDLEKTAGVGGWEPDRGGYEILLRWLVERPDERVAVRLDAWLDGRAIEQPLEERVIETGTFYELAQRWNAGEDYQRWSESPTWQPYKECLTEVSDAVRAAMHAGADERLLALAWKHLLACMHETAWQDPIVQNPLPQDDCQRAPAPWARAAAIHARACLPMTAAAVWASQGGSRASAELTDIDQDGDQEVMLCGGDLFRVITPSYGGRLVSLFHRGGEGGVLCVGNPTDHWNLQESNRYMDQPPNHPGALADAGHEHDAYAVTALRVSSAYAMAWLRNIDIASALHGARKGVLVYAETPALLVCYQLPDGVARLATRVCLSPDYKSLLETGRRELWETANRMRKCVAYRTTLTWVGICVDEDTAWGSDDMRASHGVTLRIEASSRHFHLLIGCGDPDDERCQRLFADGRRVLCGAAPGEQRKALVTSAGVSRD